jgi:4'-phosphopantetheinyl transferase
VIEIREITAEISIGLLDLKAFSAQNNVQIKRQQEKAGTRFVLQKLLGTSDFELLYTPENKPFLAGSTDHISISHSHDKLVIIVNNKQNTGIDIELLRDKVLKIRHKFMNVNEAAFAGEDIEKLIAVWASKEAMYKCFGLKNLDFKENLSVEDFDGGLILGKIETKDAIKRFELVKEKIEDYVMVYILKELAA